MRRGAGLVVDFFAASLDFVVDFFAALLLRRRFRRGSCFLRWLARGGLLWTRGCHRVTPSGISDVSDAGEGEQVFSSLLRARIRDSSRLLVGCLIVPGSNFLNCEVEGCRAVDLSLVGSFCHLALLLLLRLLCLVTAAGGDQAADVCAGAWGVARWMVLAACGGSSHGEGTLCGRACAVGCGRAVSPEAGGYRSDDAD